MAGSGAWMGPPMVVMRLDPPGPYVGGLGLRGGADGWWSGGSCRRGSFRQMGVASSLFFRERGRFAV